MQLIDMTKDQLIAKLAAMQAANVRKLTMKVSEKGAVSMYGFGKWPVTLYRSQWERLIEAVKAGHVEAFIEANSNLLATKD